MTDAESTPAGELKTERPGGFKNFLLRVYCRLLILGTLYVLSIGPMYWYWYRAKYLGEGNRAVIIFYGPLSLACEYIKPLDDWVNLYIDIWTT